MNDIGSAKAVVESYCAAWLAGDVMAVLAKYHQDLELTWPGRNHLAGIHRGQEASLDALLKLQVLTSRTPIEVVDVLQGTQSVMVKVVERWSNEAASIEPIDVLRALDFTVADQKLRTCRVFESDQPAVDDWIEAAHAAAS